MSDQPDAPPKPKVGSLRDRIAAFEKSATSAAPPPAPAPRPKPAGFASWKPKAPSPPSSPAATVTTTSDDRAAAASASSKASGMSASDAKESITKGGSLKDRMAALQGKGGFGAPPVVAPKPPMEKPKWKPPPVVHAPVDDDSQLTEGVSIAAAVERTISPPAPTVPRESLEGRKIGEEEERATSPPTGAADNEDEAGAADPEEEERQRRAAIAARMARLGGARVGMAPPVFGKKPPVRRPTQEEPPQAPEEHKPTEELSKSPSNSEAVKGDDISAPSPSNVPASSSPPGDSGATEDPQDMDRPTPARKNSESASISAADSPDSHATKAPTSMPVPAVPRRAGPPRKRPAKPTAPAPDAPEEHAVIAEEPSANSEEAKPSSVSPASAEVEQSFGNETKTDALESTSHVATPVPTLHIESLKSDSDNVTSDEKLKSPQELSSKTSSVGTPLEEGSGIASPPPTLSVSEESEDASNDFENDEDEAHNDLLVSEIVPHHHPEPLTEPGVVQKVYEKLTEVSEPVSDQREVNDDEEDEEEAEARRKRVTARLAEMGAVNPLSMPPQVISVTEEMHSPPASTPADMSSHESSSPPERPVDAQIPPSLKAADPIQPGISSESFSEVDEDQSVHEDYHERQYESLPSTTTKHHPETNSGKTHLSTTPLDGDNSSLYAEQSEQNIDSGSEYEENDVRPTHPADDVAPLSHADAPSPEPPLPPARSTQPPMRILPSSSQVSDEEYEEETEEAKDEDDDSGLQPHLFVPPPTERAQRNNINIATQRPSSADDEDESENGPPPLPYLQRRSVEVPAARSPSPPSDYASERESDHDGPALPVPAPVSSPKLTRDHQHQAIPQTKDTESPRLAPPARRPIPATPPDEPVSRSDSPATSPVPLPRLSLSTSDNEEVLDEEEGDPIDPEFYSPSRRTSSVNLQALAQSQVPQVPQEISPSSVPTASETQAEEDPQDAEQLRRQTIAERMAKLGGIRFGAAPVPIPRSQPPVAQEEQQDSAQHVSQEEATSEAMSEEEEERARKERIAAKMANMGGMRIGMMPMGMGGFPPRPPIPQTNSYDSKPPPARAIPPTRPPQPAAHPPPPPPPAVIPDVDSDHGSEAVSEDAVKVEAELSETDDYAEADIPEESPPIPSRSNRGARRQDTSSSASSPPISSRPPVPAGLPHRRSSIQTTRSMTGSSTGGEMALAATPHKSSGFMPSSQSEYVMVEEPELQDEEVPPPPPARPAGRAPPARAAPQAPPAPPPTQTSTDASDSISSQWEIPSIPGIVSALDFGGDTDLSLSWTDAGEDGVTPAPVHSDTPSPALPSAGPAQKAPPADVHLSADELMALWGRVGVQVCEIATSLFEKSKKALIGDGTYAGFVQAVLALVPNAAAAPTADGQYGYLVYMQNGPAVQKRASEIMPGDIVEIQDAKLKGHKGLQTYHQTVGGTGEVLVGVIGEFEAKKTKIRVFHANQHVGQQTVESVSYRLEDLKSGLVKVYRVLEA